MKTLSLAGMILSAVLHAGPLLPDQGITGLVEPGEHNNWLLPPDSNNFTGITLQELLKQNPQNLFAFTAQTDTGPRNLIGNFPFSPWDPPVWTTPRIGLVQKEELNFERFVQPMLPPVNPPTACVHNCNPVVPPVCIHCGSTPMLPPVCIHCGTHVPQFPPMHVPPRHDVPEPATFILIGSGCIAVALLRKR